jgi:hypothetical protein
LNKVKNPIPMKRPVLTILIVIGAFFSICGVYCLFGSPRIFYSSLGEVIYSIPMHNCKQEMGYFRGELARSENDKKKMSLRHEKELDEEKSRLEDYKKQADDKNILVMKKCLEDLTSGNVKADFIKKIVAGRGDSGIVQVDTNDKTLRLKFSDRVVYQEKLDCYFALFPIKRAVPVMEIKKGAFSFWKIYAVANDSVGFALFSLLVNERLMRIIKRDFLMEVAGMWFRSTSPSNRYFFMDYGCCPGMRELEIFDEFGNSIHKSEYVEDGCSNQNCAPLWSGDTLIYWKAIRTYTGSDDVAEMVKLCGKRVHEAVFLKQTRFYKDHETILNATRAYCF